MENETEKLMQELARLKEENVKLRKKRDEQLWKKVSVPCTLHDALMALTKKELENIRKSLYIRNASGLKKNELVKVLEENIPLHLKKFIYSFDKDTYIFLKKVKKKSGYMLYDNDLSYYEIQTLQYYGLLFPGEYDNNKILFMPEEITTLFTEIDSYDLQRKVRRNTEWIQLTTGLLYYYGVMDIENIAKKMHDYWGQEDDIADYINVISFARNYYEQIDFTDDGGLQYNTVFDVEEIIEEHKMRPSIDFYPFTKQQILKAGVPGYYDATPAMKDFLSFLQEYYELSWTELDEIAFDLTELIKMDAPLNEQLGFLQSMIEIPELDVMQEITDYLMKIYNHTRQWQLKGYTPTELLEAERKNLQLLPTKRLAPENHKASQKAKVVNINDYAKVGRNAPCPCGSGKKYKKCCYNK